MKLGYLAILFNENRVSTTPENRNCIGCVNLDVKMLNGQGPYKHTGIVRHHPLHQEAPFGFQNTPVLHYRMLVFYF